MRSAELRQSFLDYFAKNGHTVVESSSLVPAGDPSLLFTNAGMVQFKDVFIGLESRPYRRATTAQRCLRVSGKHNDLEEVGKTTRHATFFEMLGNFSFGDYFKKEAIAYAWEFVTGVLKLPQEKLWVTVYVDDDEAARLWQEIAGIPESRIVRLGEKANFWAMGDTGPCGPCSEIVIDRGEDHGCGLAECGIGKCDCDRWLELWNLVFMQFERSQDGKLRPLPKPSIDTGMGLERIAAVVQNVDSIFDTDLFRPIITEVETLCNQSYVPTAEGMPFRVIADHLRACTFLAFDGIVPSNEGRGYVFRRILRRAARFGRKLGLEQPFLYRLVPRVISLFEGAYSGLADKTNVISEVIRLEETRFSGTLDAGARRADEIVAAAKARGSSVISGRDAFMLYDSFGFPIDLTEDIANENGLKVDKAEFDQLMQVQRSKSREARAQAVKAWGDGLDLEALSGLTSEFVGYERLKVKTKLIGLWSAKGSEIQEASAGTQVLLALAEVPFYGESGGQVGDTGTIVGPSGKVNVTDTRRLGSGILVMVGGVEEGTIQVGDLVVAAVDEERRTSIARNHSATHLIHKALKLVLGEHANQCGSLVAPDKLRFDFTHFEPLTAQQFLEVESIVNDKVMENLEVEVYCQPYRDAIAEGVVALFDEKYGDIVRVVKIDNFSKELCGGTHVRNTGQIGLVKLVSESSVGAGIRRIEALTGKAALDYVRTVERQLQEAAELLKASPLEVVGRIRGLRASLQEKEAQIQMLQEKLAGSEIDILLSSSINVNGIKVVSACTRDNLSEATLRSLADGLRSRLKSGVAVLASEGQGKVSLICTITDDLVSRGMHAGKLISQVARTIGGSGGGKATTGFAGSKDASNLGKALRLVPDLVREQLAAAIQTAGKEMDR